MLIRGLAVACLAMMVAACNLPAMNAEVDTMAKGFYESVRTGADLSNDPRLVPELRTPQINQQLAPVRAMIPNETPQSIQNRSQNYQTNASGGRAELVHAYRYSDRTILAETILLKPPGSQTWMIQRFWLTREGATGAAGQNAAPAAPPAPAAEPQSPAPADAPMDAEAPPAEAEGGAKE